MNYRSEKSASQDPEKVRTSPNWPEIAAFGMARKF
jgi:hypothetical protein